MHAINDRLIQLVLVVVIFGGWQLGVNADLIDPFFFPAQLDILHQIVAWVTDSGFYRHVYITLTGNRAGLCVRQRAWGQRRHLAGT